MCDLCSSPYYFLYCCDLNSSVSNFDPLYDINNEMIKGTYPTARPCDAKNDPKYNTSEMAYACKVRLNKTCHCNPSVYSFSLWNE